MPPEFPCGRIASPPLTRRDALRRSSLGFGAIALAGLLDEDRALAVDDALERTHRPAKARNVVYFFCGGGPSQVETFDPKPLLATLGGQRVPESIAKGVPRIARSPLHGLLPPHTRFRRYGESGIAVSDLFPEVGRHVDRMCILRSCRHDSPIHAPAEYLTLTGTQTGDRPSLGAWLTYGLGSENRNLPGFVVFHTGTTVRPPGFGAGFLPARFQGVRVDLEDGVPHVDLPPGVTPGARRAQLDFLGRMNRAHLDRLAGHTELEARIRSYELAFRMQTAAPEAFDLASETSETQTLYGIGGEHTDKYGRVLLQARRLVERGTRFVMIRSGDWDFHSEIAAKQTEKCRLVDRPLAGFLADLERRGLLDETLVVWGGEFGRTPTAEGSGDKAGRDHSPSGYSMWLAGGGVAGGSVVGATDDVGYAAIERPIHPNDLHATILHLLGIDQHRLFFERHNRRELVTVNGGEVIDEILGA